MVDDSVKNAIYYALLLACIVVFAIFSYIAYMVFTATAGTDYTFLAYIMILPIIVSKDPS